jgi:hypothetical protein
VGWPSEPTPSSLESTDCSALLLHPTETVRRRLLAQGQPNQLLTSLGPATDRDSQLNPVAYSYKITCAVLILLHSHHLSSPLTYNYLLQGASACCQTPKLSSLPNTYYTHTTIMVCSCSILQSHPCSQLSAGYFHDRVKHCQRKLYLLACLGQVCSCAILAAKIPLSPSERQGHRRIRLD